MTRVRKRIQPPRRSGRPRKRAELQAVVDETIALYRWLAWTADQLYGDETGGASRRWVVRQLHRHGPLTVPALARTRAMRRQSVQTVVDSLLADRLVDLVANRRHARSQLVRLTPHGIGLAERMDRIDVRVLTAIGSDLSASNFMVTASTLAAIRAQFEAGRWRLGLVEP